MGNAYPEGVGGDAPLNRCRHRVDASQDVAFGSQETRVLMFVLLPGADHERLFKQVAVSQISRETPAARARPPAGTAQIWDES